MNRLVLSTTASREEARRIGRALVERRLAACVNIVGPIESIYRWQGKVEDAEEFLLVMKTTEQSVAGLQEALRGLHSYDLPECIALEIAEGSAEYLRWIEESVGAEPAG
jgi:periplasmic divalent cation tolerance protein